MSEFLTIVFWALAAFVVMDYPLGRAEVKEVWRWIVSILFAVLFVVVVHGVLR